MSTAAQHCSGHMSFSDSSDLINCSLKQLRLVLTTFQMSSGTSCSAVLIVLAYDHCLIRNRQPCSVMTVDMSVRAYHDGWYRLTCQSVTSGTSARLCPIW
ncbi:hypothetical protein AMTRI_Chr13g88630 [Amborella trichopoda]